MSDWNSYRGRGGGGGGRGGSGGRGRGANRGLGHGRGAVRGGNRGGRGGFGAPHHTRNESFQHGQYLHNQSLAGSFPLNSSFNESLSHPGAQGYSAEFKQLLASPQSSNQRGAFSSFSGSAQPQNHYRVKSAPTPLFDRGPRPNFSRGGAISVGGRGGGGRGGGGRDGSRYHNICIPEEVKIIVTDGLQEFLRNDEQNEFTFPATLTNTERAFVHRYCQSIGLKSKSYGRGDERRLTVTKPVEDSAQNNADLTLSDANRKEITELRTLLAAEKIPAYGMHRIHVSSRINRGQSKPSVVGGLPGRPPPPRPNALSDFRQSLPIFPMRRRIVDAIAAHQVVLITGETGSGKTTQVPQFIMEDNAVKPAATGIEPIRIVCAEPRRLATMSVSARVAQERGESLGRTVGYQVRLESSLSQDTLCVFCTYGVLLRYLMTAQDGAEAFHLTHVIIDEIHERDKISDFLLIELKHLVSRLPKLKLILMSASMNVDTFLGYFEGCSVIEVPGRMFDVEEYYLEDILLRTGYANDKMKKFKKMSTITSKMNRSSEKMEGLKKSMEVFSIKTDAATDEPDELESEPTQPKLVAMDAMLIKEMDTVIDDILEDPENEDNFDQLFCLILSDDADVNHAHSKSGVTPIIAVVKAGHLGSLHKLLGLGAEVDARDKSGKTCLDYCGGSVMMSQMLLAQKKPDESSNAVGQSASTPAQSIGGGSAERLVTDENSKEILDIYHSCFDDEQVDIDLILLVVKFIVQNHSRDAGAVLIFLPGYDEIMQLKDSLQSMSNKFVPLRVLALHSKLQSKDHWQVFERAPAGVRKIILATNIAETSLTIDDVTIVIDSGKVKETAFDSMSSLSLLKSNWISKASAIQRRGRAGRCAPGVCYRLFSRQRFESFQDHAVPEILRVPLEELCLHTKLLAPSGVSILGYLSNAPNPPAPNTIKAAITVLKKMDALTDDEELTELGLRLAKLPLPPHLGKMILYAAAMRCLDPILVVVAVLAYRDPFVLPVNSFQRNRAASAKLELSENTYSDHYALIKGFREWSEIRSNPQRERSYCDRYFLSSSTMKTIADTKSKIQSELSSVGIVDKGGKDNLNRNSLCWPFVKAAIVAGRYPNVLRVDMVRNQLVAAREHNVRFHSSSALHPVVGRNSIGMSHQRNVGDLPFDWIIYEELAKSSRHAAVKQATCVSSLSVSLFAGSSRFLEAADSGIVSGGSLPEAEDDANRNPLTSYLEHLIYDSNEPAVRSGAEATKVATDRTIFFVDEWIKFRGTPEEVSMMTFLKTHVQSLVSKRLRGQPFHPLDDRVLNVVKKMLVEKECESVIQNPLTACLNGPTGGARAPSHRRF